MEEDKMSELRRECYGCLNRNGCIGEYRSIYCMLSRKYDFNNIDYGREKDKTSNSMILSPVVLENRINNLEYKLSKKQYKDYKEKYKILGEIKAYKSILNL